MFRQEKAHTTLFNLSYNRCITFSVKCTPYDYPIRMILGENKYAFVYNRNVVIFQKMNLMKIQNCWNKIYLLFLSDIKSSHVGCTSIDYKSDKKLPLPLMRYVCHHHKTSICRFIDKTVCKHSQLETREALLSLEEIFEYRLMLQFSILFYLSMFFNDFHLHLIRYMSKYAI